MSIEHTAPTIRIDNPAARDLLDAYDHATTRGRTAERTLVAMISADREDAETALSNAEGALDERGIAHEVANGIAFELDELPRWERQIFASFAERDADHAVHSLATHWHSQRAGYIGTPASFAEAVRDRVIVYERVLRDRWYTARVLDLWVF